MKRYATTKEWLIMLVFTATVLTFVSLILSAEGCTAVPGSSVRVPGSQLPVYVTSSPPVPVN